MRTTRNSLGIENSTLEAAMYLSRFLVPLAVSISSFSTVYAQDAKKLLTISQANGSRPTMQAMLPLLLPCSPRMASSMLPQEQYLRVAMRLRKLLRAA
jgi:hypothetical protein